MFDGLIENQMASKCEFREVKIQGHFYRQSTQSSFCYCEQAEPTILKCKSLSVVCTENQFLLQKGEVFPGTHEWIADSTVIAFLLLGFRPAGEASWS